MKKLIAILLALACVFSLAACSVGGNGDLDQTPANESEEQALLDALSELIRTSEPNKSTVTTETGTKDIVLYSEMITQKGMLGDKEASLYTYEYETLNDLGDKNLKTVHFESKEYVNDPNLGLRVDGGTWESNASNFVRKIQPYRMTLDAAYIKDLRTDKEETKFSFSVPQDYVSDIFTNFDAKTLATINSDVSVYIETDGASVLSIQIEYAMKSNVAQLKNPTVKIVATYDYHIQPITLLK